MYYSLVSLCYYTYNYINMLSSNELVIAYLPNNSKYFLDYMSRQYLNQIKRNNITACKCIFDKKLLHLQFQLPVSHISTLYK